MAEALSTVAQGLASDDHGMLVATEGDTPIGWVWYEPRGTFHHGGYVRILAVDSGHGRRGVASALMDRAEAEIFAVSGSVFLLASEWNHRACAFYEKRGYQAVGRLEDYSCAGYVEAIYWLSRGTPLLANRQSS
jgi:ribosomal protein S18 acetylase RimI-like enzyme